MKSVLNSKLMGKASDFNEQDGVASNQNLEIIDFNGSQKSEISDETGRFV